jgi:hypothetical protein
MKKYFSKIIIFLAIISVLSIIYISLNNKRAVETKIVPTTNINIKDIKIGSSIDDITKSLGRELNSTISGNLLINEYQSKNIYRPHQIYFDNNISKLIIEEVTDKSITTDKMREKYGISEQVLYEKLEHSSFNLFVYPLKGIAYRGHANGGLVLEIWYFEPTDIKTFIQKYATNYQEELFTQQRGY